MTKETNFEHPPRGHVGLLAYDSVNDRFQVVYVGADGRLHIDVKASALPSGAATAAKQLADGHNVTVDNADIEVVQPTPADLKMAQHQYDGAAWRKSNLLWGYNGLVAEAVDDEDLGADTQYLNGTTVPAGEIWVLSTVTGAVASGTAVNLFFTIISNGVTMHVFSDPSPTSGQWYVSTGQFVLGYQDYVQLQIQSCTAGDVARMRYGGYKMKLNM